MAFMHLPFSAMPFAQSPTHPLEQKKASPGANAVLLRFAPGFADPNLCRRSHAIYVVEGELELELEDGVKRLERGDACWLEHGCAHRARNPGQEATVLFVVSDLEGPQASVKARS